MPVEVEVTFAKIVGQAAGTNLLSCLQCGKCSAGCPVAARADIKPHELVRLTQLGEREAVLGSRLLWECTSCHTCITRCPQKVDIGAAIDTLRQMARSGAAAIAQTTVPVFNDVFLRSVERFGRMWEVGLMASYKLRTGTLFQDMNKAPLMFKKGKLALLPKSAGERGERKKLFEAARNEKAEGRKQKAETERRP